MHASTTTQSMAAAERTATYWRRQNIWAMYECMYSQRIIFVFFKHLDKFTSTLPRSLSRSSTKFGLNEPMRFYWKRHGLSCRAAGICMPRCWFKPRLEHGNGIPRMDNMHHQFPPSCSLYFFNLCMLFYCTYVSRVLHKSWWQFHPRLYQRFQRDFEKKQKLATAVMREQKEEQERLTRIREIELQKIKDKAKQKAQRAIKFVLLFRAVC